MAGGALIFVQVIFGLVSLLDPATAALELSVAYPDPSNRSVVELSCREGVFPVDGAQFRRNDAVITTNNGLVSDVSESTGTITFSFTQQQEGVFTCTHQTSTSPSNAIGLAAAPSVDYSNEQRDRYITFPSPENQHIITLHCDIQPGLLTNRYTIKWSKESNTGPGFIQLADSGFYDFTTAVSPTDVLYQCTVEIRHRSDGDSPISYDGPRIIIHKAVLTEIRVNDALIQHETATQGESVNFTCSFSLDRNVDLDIQWAVNGTSYSSCDVPDESNGCFTDRTESNTITSVLTIEDTSSLTPGNHTVQCSAIQSLHKNFTTDPSYDASATNANAVQSSATLTIIQVSSTITMTETPTATPTSGSEPSSGIKAAAVSAGVVVGVLLLVVAVLVILVVIFCCLRKKGDGDPEGKGTRCFAWKPKHDVETGDGPNQPNEIYEMKQPEIHVSPNKQFHSGDTPELRRQNARPNGSKNNSLDPLESIYNVSMISAVSGESALTDDGSLSNPPSPTVSDIHNGEEESPSDRYLSQPGPSSFEGPGDEGHHHHYQHHDHRYDEQGYYDQHPEYPYDSHNYTPSQALSFGIYNMFECYSHSSQPIPYSESSRHPSVYQEPSHHGYDQQSSLDIPLDVPRIGSTSSVHSDRTHSTKHSKGSSRSGKSSRSGRSDRLDVEQEHSRRHSASPHLPRERHHRRHSPSSHHSDRYSSHHSDHHSSHHSDHHSNHHSDHHSSHSRSPRSRSPRPAFEPAHFTHFKHHDHRYDEQGYYDQRPEYSYDSYNYAPSQASSFGIHNMFEGYSHGYGSQPIPYSESSLSHMHKEAGKVIKESQRGDFDPTGRRQQMRISLASQDISKDIHPHYHMTSRSHIRQSDGRQRFLQRRRSKSMDLTPVVELPESCATTPGVAIPDRAKGLLCGHMFSPAMTPTGESFRVLSPTAPTLNTIAPLVLLREISLPADNLPALCLNDCPMAVTPMTQLGNRTLGTSAARSPLSNTQRRWSVGPVNSPLPSLTEKDSPTSSEEGLSDRYMSQDSSSTLQTTSTQSSLTHIPEIPHNIPSFESGYGTGTQSSTSTSATDPEESVKRRQYFVQREKQKELTHDPDSVLPNESGYGTGTQSSTSTSATDPEESVKRRQYFVQREKQKELTHDPDSVLPNESGYGTSIDTADSESTSLRTRLPPGDLPISPQVPPKQKNIARVLEQQKHLVPIVSKSMDLTPVVELPESCATTPGVAIPDRAKGLLCGHMFSPAMIPMGESFRVLSPTTPTNSRDLFQATPRPENPFLPRYSADPYNTAEHIPKWMKPVATLTDCTSDGRSYYDEHNDFRLEIPQGAIPEGERVTIDIGVALYGPYQYPKGLRPVSPVFWVCVRDRENFRFLKPVKITIEHCLSLDRDTDTHSLGFTFLKAGHTLNSAGMYELHSADGAQDFQSDLSHGTLTTDHFCFLCISGKDDHETAKRNGYYLIRAHVNPIAARGIQVMEFFITLKLKCCVGTVKIQCRDKGYGFHFQQFYFNLEDGDGILTIKYTCTIPEMWNIGLTSSEKILAKDVLFDKNDVEYMELLENTGQYPPRFSLELDGTDSTKTSKVKFEFTGATEELVIDVLLPKDVQSPTSSFASNVSRLRLSSSVGSDTALSNPPDLCDLLSEVADDIPTKWERVGTQLRLEYSQLQTFKCDDPLDSFCKVFDAWQRQCNAPHTLSYTWESMIDVLRRVKEHALANALLEKLH